MTAAISHTSNSECYVLDRRMPRTCETKIRVIYGDTDQMNVVYYANYLRYFEAGRNEFFRERGGTYKEMEKSGFMLPVIEVGVRYKAAAKYDDVVVVKTSVDDVRRVSLRFTYELMRESDRAVLTTGFTRHGCLDLSGKPSRLPEVVVKMLTLDSPARS